MASLTRTRRAAVPVGAALVLALGRASASAVAALPFFLLMCLGVALPTAFPGIALWPPARPFDRPG